MTTQQAQMIEDSWHFLVTNIKEPGRLFYERLFQQNPALKSLFKGNQEEQEKKLISLIAFAVRKLRNLDTIVADIEALGTRHKGYGVKEEHYNEVASALLWTLEKGLGTRWNEDIRKAWTELYATIAEIMTKAPADS